MLGGLLALSMAGLISVNRDHVIKECSKSKRFALSFAFVGCAAVISAAMLYLKS